MIKCINSKAFKEMLKTTLRNKCIKFKNHHFETFGNELLSHTVILRFCSTTEDFSEIPMETKLTILNECAKEIMAEQKEICPELKYKLKITTANMNENSCELTFAPHMY